LGKNSLFFVSLFFNLFEKRERKENRDKYLQKDSDLEKRF